VSSRPLVFVSGLTIGDYFLWSWSLNSNHEVIALISGLTLPPLALVLIWLLASAAGRVIARLGRRSGAEQGLVAPRASRGARARRATAAASAEESTHSNPSTPSRKIAA
jgi:hypothetical protein